MGKVLWSGKTAKGHDAEVHTDGSVKMFFCGTYSDPVGAEAEDALMAALLSVHAETTALLERLPNDEDFRQWYKDEERKLEATGKPVWRDEILDKAYARMEKEVKAIICAALGVDP